MADNLVKAGELAAKKPYRLAYYRKMFPVIIGRATELSNYITRYIQKNQKRRIDVEGCKESISL